MCGNYELTYKIQMADIEEELKQEILEYIYHLEGEVEYLTDQSY